MNTITTDTKSEYRFCYWLISNKYKVFTHAIYASNCEEAEAIGKQLLINKGIASEDILRTNVQSVSRGSNDKYSAQRESLVRSMNKATLGTASDEKDPWN